MQVCKNKKSGKYFIYIQDTGNNEVLLITPEADIKSLDATLFEDSEDLEADFLLANNQLTEEQIQRLEMFEKERSDDAVEDIEYDFNQMSPSDQKRFIELIKKKISDTE